MNLKLWRKLLVASFFGFLLMGNQASASIDEFGFMLEAPGASSSLSDLVVTPDGRFVVGLDANDDLTFFDTWDFDFVTSDGDTVLTVAFDDAVLCLDISPDGNYAYVGSETGILYVVSLGPLYDHLPYNDFTDELLVTEVTVSDGNKINQIAAIYQDGGSTGTAYIIMAVDGTNYGIHYLTQIGTSVDTQVQTILDADDILELERGTNHAFVLYEGVSNFSLGKITCYNTTGTCDQNKSTINSGSTVERLVVNPGNDGYVVTYDETNYDLMVFDGSVTGGSINAGSTILASASQGLAILSGSTTDILFSIGNDELASFEIDSSSQVFGNTIVDTITSPASISASNSDEYVYVSSQGDIHVYTANPWIENIEINGGDTVTMTSGDTIHVSFTVNAWSDIDYSVYSDEIFSSWSGLVADGSTNLSGSSVTIETYMNSSVFDNECENLLTITATDDTDREGRNSTVVHRDYPPPSPSLNTGFGDTRIEYDFSANDPCDLDYYEVYYGTNNVVIDSYTVLTDSGSGYTKHKTFTDPEDNEKLSDDIEGLINGTTYYIYLVTFDDSGNITISNRKSEVPQKTASLTKLTGEDGGIDCLGSVSGNKRGDPWSVLLLMIPLLIVKGVSITRRWAR